MGEKNSKADHPDCFVRIGSPSGFISQYSHNACLVPTYLSLSLSFFSVMRGEEPILTGVKKSWSFLIFLPVAWALGSLLEIGSESQQAGDHPTHPHHSSILEPAWNNIPVNILPTKNGGSVKDIFKFKLLNLKVPKCELFDWSDDFHDSYTIKPFWIDDFGAKIYTSVEDCI